MFLLVPIAFYLLVAATAFIWNRYFDERVSSRVVLLFAAIVTLYQAETFFTPRVDVPAGLAYAAYPWRALNDSPVRANTGIVFTQMIPWTDAARDAVLRGELPLWNRTIGGGSPLLANLQNTIAHPFTFIGVVLPIGKAWTLSVALRLFFSLFFLHVFLRAWKLPTVAAIFGALAYTFSTFHVVALLFPLGLTMMSLPMTLAAAHEFITRPRRRSFALLVTALSLAVVGGHPESSLWVGLTTGAYSVYAATTLLATWSTRGKTLTLAAVAAIAACSLTSPVWYPTTAILAETERYESLTSSFNMRPHDIGADWMFPLLVPNILGTPQWGSYRTPEKRHPTLPDDYGEVASGYAGAVAIAFTLVAAFGWRRRPFWFFTIAMFIGFFTIYETPGWYPLVREIPWLGIALHQRWRFLWALGMAINGALGVAALIESNDRLLVRRAVVATTAILSAIYFFRLKEFLARGVVGEQIVWLAITIASLLVVVLALRKSELTAARVGTVAVFLELVAVGFRYNPPASPKDFYPITGAIESMQQRRAPYRIAALGWSFLSDVPGYYGLEDVKTTDVIQYDEYLKLFRYFLKTSSSDFNQSIGDVSQPFFDYLNVAFVYAPPGEKVTASDFRLKYRGEDGDVYENTAVLPRYFLVGSAEVRRAFRPAAEKLVTIGDFRHEATVDHIPAKIARMSGLSSPGRDGDHFNGAGGRVKILRYGANETTLDIESYGWNLLVSSDVNMPGWRAYWNGDRLPPVIVNGAFLGSFIPPGKGTLRFRYLPNELEDAVRAAGATIVIMAMAFGAIGLVRRRNRREEESSPAAP